MTIRLSFREILIFVRPPVSAPRRPSAGRVSVVFSIFFDQLPEAVASALVVGIEQNYSQMKDLDLYFNFEKGFIQIRPIAQKLWPPEVGHLGERRGAAAHKRTPASERKKCSNFDEIRRIGGFFCKFYRLSEAVASALVVGIPRNHNQIKVLD